MSDQPSPSNRQEMDIFRLDPQRQKQMLLGEDEEGLAEFRQRFEEWRRQRPDRHHLASQTLDVDLIQRHNTQNMLDPFARRYCFPRRDVMHSRSTTTPDDQA